MSACLLGTRSTGLSMPISDMDAHSLEQYINPPKKSISLYMSLRFLINAAMGICHYAISELIIFDHFFLKLQEGDSFISFITRNQFIVLEFIVAVAR